MTLDIANIVHVLGGEKTGRDSCNVPGPGHGPKDRSLSIKLIATAPGGFVVYSHSRDNAIECRDYVRQRLGLGDWRQDDHQTPLVVSRRFGPDPNKDRMKTFALKIWSQAVSPAGSIVEYYLREHRGLSLDYVNADAVRFHGSLRFDGDRRLPGMVCLFRNIVTDEPCGIHRTFLDRESAQKVDRKMLGIAKGAAIKFDRDLAGSLTIGEGVETVLSAKAAGLGASWALGSSGAVKAFPVVKSLSELTILEENDPTSRRDVKVCAKRYLDAGKPINIVTPHVGNDFNDAWRAAQ